MHTLDNKNTLKELNDLLFWANQNNRRTRGKWAQIFFELREEDLQWILDLFISKEVVMEGRRCVVLPLPDNRGIFPYAPFLVLRQFGKKQTMPRERIMALMYMTLGTTGWTMLQRCSENGRMPSAWAKTVSPLTDSTLDVTKATKHG